MISDIHNLGDPSVLSPPEFFKAFLQQLIIPKSDDKGSPKTMLQAQARHWADNVPKASTST